MILSFFIGMVFGSILTLVLFVILAEESNKREEQTRQNKTWEKVGNKNT